MPPFFGPVSDIPSLKSNIGSGLVFGGQVKLAAQAGRLGPSQMARVYLLQSELNENEGRLRLAERYADTAFVVAKEANNLSLVLTSRLRKAVVVSRRYEDAAALAITRAIQPDLLAEPDLRLNREILECVFSFWAGERPPPATLRRAIERVGSDPQRWETELAFLIQGLEVGYLDLDPFPPFVLGRTHRRVDNGERYLEELINLRRRVFTGSSLYAYLLDLLNRVKEGMAGGVPGEQLLPLFYEAYRLASAMGAKRLERVFTSYSTRLYGSIVSNGAGSLSG